jgi:hypothetical protein
MHGEQAQIVQVHVGSDVGSMRQVCVAAAAAAAVNV